MRSILLGAAAVVIVACDASAPPAFRYAICCPGCDTTTPMMLGDEESIVVTGSIPDTVSVESTAPSVMPVKQAARACCPIGADAASTVCRTIALGDACSSQETASLAITVDALTEGSSELRVKKSDGSVWGSVTLSVEKPVSLSLACNTQGSVTIAQGDSCLVAARALDANGTALMSTQGIFLTSSDPNVVVFDALLTFDKGDMPVFGCHLNDSSDVDMFAKGAGDAIVTATAGGASQTLAVHVTP